MEDAGLSLRKGLHWYFPAESTIYVSWGCLDRLSQSGWLKTTGSYSLTSLEVRGPKSRCQQSQHLFFCLSGHISVGPLLIEHQSYGIRVHANPVRAQLNSYLQRPCFPTWISYLQVPDEYKPWVTVFNPGEPVI